MSARASTFLVRRALRIQQSPTCAIYCFSLTAREIFQIADISRVKRDEGGDLIGYQRPEVQQHIQEIVDYLETEDIIFPNPIIVALPTSVRFTSGRGPTVGDGIAAAGTLRIPLPKDDDPKPGWIVDGQQRALALVRSSRQDLAIPVNAFITDSVDVQRDQFVRINSSKPLPRGLVTELLPAITSQLPQRLALRKTPSALCELLNSEPESPFCGLIRRSSADARSRRSSVIADTSIVNMLKESITSSSGCLFPYRDAATGETDLATMFHVQVTYWNAVKATFPQAWGLDPSKSRLMHGAGIRAMGRLMDRMMLSINLSQEGAQAEIAAELNLIAPCCHWSSGKWDGLNLRWNEIQNVPRHTSLLSNYLVRAYVQAKAA